MFTEASRGPPDVTETVHAAESAATRSAATTGLFVLAVLYTVYFAREFLMPIAFALLLTFLLSPVVRALGKLRIPAPLAAAALVLALSVGVGVAGYELAGPVETWAGHLPETVRKAGFRLRGIERPVNQVVKAADQVERAAATEASPRGAEVVVKGPTLAARLFGTSQALAAGALEVMLLLYFLLAAGDLFLEKLVKVLPQFSDKRTAVSIARTTEASISTYLLTTATINLGEGIVLSLALWALGAPTPLLWGSLVVFLEFIPYIGMLVMTVILTVLGLTTFDSLPHALALPGVFLVITFMQANVVTPLVMSKRLTLNPVALFVGLAFGWWVWGVAGAFLAVPLLSAFKICCDHLERLSSIGEFLGGRDPEGRRNTVRAPTAEADLRGDTRPAPVIAR